MPNIVITAQPRYPGLGEQAFLDADHTKLDGIETAADITDATNVNAAGAIMKTLLTEQGDIIYGSAVSTPAALVHGKLWQILQSGGHDANPSWIAIRNAWLAQVMLFTLEYDTGLTETVSGTGSSLVAKVRARVRTGATINSTAGRVCAGGLWHQYNSSSWRWTTSCRLNLNALVCTNLDCWLGWFADATTYPTTASHHYGIHVTAAAGYATIIATNAYTAETTTNMITTYEGASVDFLIMYGSANIKYYYSTDGGVTYTLGATHSTTANFPTAEDLYHGIWLKTTVANEDKLAYLYASKYIASAD